MTWQVPPAASIFWRADFEKPWAWTVSALLSSPWPSTFTGTARRVARPAVRSDSGVTSAPASKRSSRSRRFTGWLWVRNRSNGIDFFIVGPRSFLSRMWIGNWPPSKRARSLLPERAPAPLWPRPAVLPYPEPSPRPTRLRGLRDPAGGLSECRPIRSAIGHLYEVAHRVDQPAYRRMVLALSAAADLAEPKRAQRLALLRVRAVRRAHLGDGERGHQAGTSPSPAGASAAAGASSGAAGASAASDSSAPGWPAASDTSDSSAAGWPAALDTSDSSAAGSRPSSPSTSATVRPRSSATCLGSRRVWSASTVALTRLMGFWLPSDFDSTSWIPASSSTARTPPPAITPVPAEAGCRRTRDAEWVPITSWVMVEPCMGTRKRFLRARSTPFWIATGTSFALP